MYLRNCFRLVVSILVLAVLHGCKHKDGQVPPEENTTEVGKVVISEMKQVVSKTLSGRGGEVGIQDAQSSLNGFKITVPDGAYTGGAEFSVSTAKVVRQNFGDEYKVLSPLISIAAPSGNSDDLITIEVPINLPKDHFATAVFINEEGKPDLLPMVSLSEKNIVLAVNSFNDNATFDDWRESQSYSAFLSIDFYNNVFKGKGDYTISAPLNTETMLSPYASRAEFYAPLPPGHNHYPVSRDLASGWKCRCR